LLLFVIFCYNFDNISRQNGKILLDSKKCEKRPILNIKINAGELFCAFSFVYNFL